MQVLPHSFKNGLSVWIRSLDDYAVLKFAFLKMKNRTKRSFHLSDSNPDAHLLLSFPATTVLGEETSWPHRTTGLIKSLLTGKNQTSVTKYCENTWRIKQQSLFLYCPFLRYYCEREALPLGHKIRASRRKQKYILREPNTLFLFFGYFFPLKAAPRCTPLIKAGFHPLWIS